MEMCFEKKILEIFNVVWEMYKNDNIYRFIKTVRILAINIKYFVQNYSMQIS